MAPATIRFYFDYESPNAYLAWTQLPKLAQRHGCAVDPVPILYAALLDAHGQLGPGEQPAKGRWMIKNLARKALLLGVPLSPPAFLPFNPLLALRVTLLASRSAERDALIDALFRAVWVHGLHVSEASVVERVVNEVGLPGAALVAQTQSPGSRAGFARRPITRSRAGSSGCPRWRWETSSSGATTISPISSSFSPGRIPSTRPSGGSGIVPCPHRRPAGASGRRRRTRRVRARPARRSRRPR